MRTTFAVLALAGVSAFAPSALADGREPGSVLVYPFQGQVLGLQAIFNVISVTNTNRAGSGETDVHFEYVNVNPTFTSLLFADCNVSDRVETLTPADTLTVLNACHNGILVAKGYLVVTARDPELVDTPWSFNHLIGSEQIITLGGGMYSLNAQPFVSPLAQGTATDLDADGRRDFNDLEYEGIADELYIDSYMGVIPGEIVLVGLLGGEYLINVNFIIYNDDEFQLSGQHSFACWTRTPLQVVSGYFTEAGLFTTANDPTSLDLNCDGIDDFETGWAIVRPVNALSITSGNVTNPAVLGALTADFAPFMNARELWESPTKQLNGEFGS